MLSLLRIVTTPITLKLSPPSHQLSPYSPLGKRATFTTVLADASNSPAGGHPPLTAICHPKGVNLFITDTLPFVTRSLPICDVDNDAGNANPSTSPNSTTSFAPTTYPYSIFPVYGPFDLLYCVQTGGFGTAWAAKDRSTGRLLCLKVFQSVQDPSVSRSVRAEIRTFRRLVKSKRGEKGKQFIMELNRSFQHGTDVFFAMELMTTDLGSYLFIEPERCKLHARRWMAQIALGIESLHEMAIIHRDIKTENILIDSRENIRIIDFGLTFLGPPGMPLCQWGTHPTEFLGTPPYMAPEVLWNKGLPTDLRWPYGEAVDWWALGCILFELESRDHQLLFNAEEDVRAYVAWTQRPCQVEQMYPRFEGLDPVIVDLLEGLLQIEPSTRYSLNNLEKHDYFLQCDGTSEFDNAAARALERPVRPDLVPQFTEGHGPIKVIGAAKVCVSNDWINLKWAHPVDS